MIQPSYLFLLVDAILITGLFFYYFGLIIFSEELISISIYFLSCGLGIIVLHLINKLSNRIGRDPQKFLKSHIETAELGRYIITTSVLAILALISLIFFYASWNRLTEGYNGWEMFNFFNF